MLDQTTKGLSWYMKELEFFPADDGTIGISLSDFCFQKVIQQEGGGWLEMGEPGDKETG